MKLIAGLGNPGVKYKSTRHNTGFMVVEAFRKEKELPPFKARGSFAFPTTQGFVNKEKVLLVKPAQTGTRPTYMNESGKAIAALKNYYKTKNEDIVVIHDDADIELGGIRIVKNKGAAGHKGVRSVIQSLGTKDFIRLRVGIRPQEETASLNKKGLEEFVLKRFTKKEKTLIKESVQECVSALDILIKEGLEKTMNKFN
ncbi:MAG: aminoacyl-tRNA hydrolase [Candidatus Nealsonbacteria bacterium]|nr:aminoacyl-tRNA hydrolase [Candidatus Nealsonbacteria bacterium]